jgi:outer membrane protein TolC
MFARAGMALILCVAMIATGCARRFYRQSADRETAAIIKEKSPRVPNMDPKFTIEASEAVTLEGLPVLEKGENFFGPDAGSEAGSRIVSLEKALEVAVKHSRSYQNRKELLYLQALSLSLDRHRFTPIFSGGASGRFNRSTSAVAGTVDSVVEERSLSASGNLRADVLLHSGARVATAFTTDFLRFITGDPRVTTSSALAGTLTQPLLRGAGYKIATESLTQSERNMLYALRDFTQFRKDFSVQIASAYYGVLQNRDSVRNSWNSFQSFKQNVERSRAMADEGRLAQSELDRLKQAELTTESAWINDTRAYRQNLDRFKILLGLSTDARIVLDGRDLEQLQIVHPKITPEEGVKVALVWRLDLHTQHEQVEDSIRRVEVAANALLPQANLVAAVNVNRTSDSWFPNPDIKRYQWNAGLDVELPLDRKSERNNYRAALISQERAVRELDLAVDNIKLQIADGWRNLDQAKRGYEIGEVGVGLSIRRVEEQQMRAELGLGKALDLVDAENALLSAKNSRTTALVSHTIARLQFWRDMGILFIRDNGQMEEKSHAEIK